jgi:hypothetical protein
MLMLSFYFWVFRVPFIIVLVGGNDVNYHTQKRREAPRMSHEKQFLLQQRTGCDQ